MKIIFLILPTAMLLTAVKGTLPARDAESSIRTSLNAEVKIARNLKLGLTPEYRISPGSGSSSLLLRTGLQYKVAGWLSVGEYYRLSANPSRYPKEKLYHLG